MISTFAPDIIMVKRNFIILINVYVLSDIHNTLRKLMHLDV